VRLNESRNTRSEQLLVMPTIYSSVLAKAWYRGAPPHCSAAKIINYLVANKAGPTLMATWQDPTAATYSTWYMVADHASKSETLQDYSV